MIPVTPIPNSPVKFASADVNEDCVSCGAEDWCQIAEKTDPLCFQWLASSCDGHDLMRDPGDQDIGGFGTFPFFVTWWTTPGWTWSPTQANHIVGTTNTLRRLGVALTNGQWYKVTYEVKRVTNPFIEITGSVRVALGLTNGEIRTKAGTYTDYIQATGTFLEFKPSIAFDGAIDSVTCVDFNADDYLVGLYDLDGNVIALHEVSALTNGWVQFCLPQWSQITEQGLNPFEEGGGFALADGCYRLCVIDACENGGKLGDIVVNGTMDTAANWSDQVDGDWTYGAGKWCHNAGNTGYLVQTLPFLLGGRTYRLEYQVLNRTVGSVTPNLGGTNGVTRSADGSYSELITTPGVLTHSDIRFVPSNTFDGCIDNVSLIMDAASLVTAMCSECFNVRVEHDCSKLIKWTNDDNAFGFLYVNPISGVDLGLTHSIRLQAMLLVPKYPESLEEFDDSGGTSKVLYASSEKVWEFNTSFVPEYVHDALRLGKIHDHFFIETLEYKCLKGDYVPEFKSKAQVLTEARFDVRRKTDDNKNFNC